MIRCTNCGRSATSWIDDGATLVAECRHCDIVATRGASAVVSVMSRESYDLTRREKRAERYRAMDAARSEMLGDYPYLRRVAR